MDTPRKGVFRMWYHEAMQKKGMGILVLAAFFIVIGILVYVTHDRSLEVTSVVPETSSNPSLEAGSAQAVAADSNVTSQDATATSTKKMEPSTTTANGLKITELAQGSGTAAKNGDKVSVNYTGMLDNGTVFDSNVDPKFNHVEPFQFTLGAGMVIQGWDQGVLGMKVGEKRRLVIPASLGYGAQGAGGGVIPPNATLTFEVQVTAIAPGH